MPEAIPPQLVTGGGLATLVLFAVWLLFTGRLLSRAAHEEILSAERQRAEDFKAALAASEEARAVLAEQLGEILTFVRQSQPHREGV